MFTIIWGLFNKIQHLHCITFKQSPLFRAPKSNVSFSINIYISSSVILFLLHLMLRCWWKSSTFSLLGHIFKFKERLVIATVLCVLDYGVVLYIHTYSQTYILWRQFIIGLRFIRKHCCLLCGLLDDLSWVQKFSFKFSILVRRTSYQKKTVFCPRMSFCTYSWYGLCKKDSWNC